MQAFTGPSLLQYICEKEKSYGVYVLFPSVASDKDIADLTKVCPCIDMNKSREHWDIALQGEGYFLFDTEKQMDDCVDQIITNDAEAEEKGYKGNTRVFLVTCGNWDD